MLRYLYDNLALALAQCEICNNEVLWTSLIIEKNYGAEDARYTSI